jgi:hypothetical protein
MTKNHVFLADNRVGQPIVSHRGKPLNKSAGGNMTLENALQKELERVDTLTIVEAIAYVNKLNSRLRRNHCTDEDRKTGLLLLERLLGRLGYLSFMPEPTFFQTNCDICSRYKS